MRLESYPPPYFVAFAFEDVQSADVVARFGEVSRMEHAHSRPIYTEVRVGDYAFDNTAGSGESSDVYDLTYVAPRMGPLRFDAAALRAAFWLLADEQYKGATSLFLKKKGARAYQIDPSDKDGCFTKEKARQDEKPVPALVWSDANEAALAKRVSSILGKEAHVFDSTVALSAQRRERHFTSSEGARLLYGRRIYAAQLSAMTRAKDGILLESQRAFYAASRERLPSDAQLEAEARALAADLKALAEAPMIDPYTGPAILAPEAAGVLFHEALGHRLEGERQKDSGDGQTFKGQIGQRVLPAFIDVVDDPTLVQAHGLDLNGFYEFDEEGIPAERVSLVEKGLLKGFLLSRTPVEGFARSNGHGRAEMGQKPQARMGTTIVNARGGVSEAELKRLLIAEAKKQGKPYGLILRDVAGGQTSTETGGYQAFKGAPRMVYTVDVKTGEERLVRGVEIVGTPLSALSRILAAGTDPRVFNGYCGAESGYVPVSTIAPALLLSEIELQRSSKERQRAPLLPRP
jgi:TldD protein